MGEYEGQYRHDRRWRLLSVMLLCGAAALATFILAREPPRMRYVPSDLTIPCSTLLGGAIGAWFRHPIVGAGLGFFGGLAAIFYIVFGLDI